MKHFALIAALMMGTAAPAWAQTNTEKTDAFVHCTAMYAATGQVSKTLGNAENVKKMEQTSAVTRLAAIYYALDGKLNVEEKDAVAAGQAVDASIKSETEKFVKAVRSSDQAVLKPHLEQCAGLQNDLNVALAAYKDAVKGAQK